jgi:hypothetical protein
LPEQVGSAACFLILEGYKALISILAIAQSLQRKISQVSGGV